MVVSSDTDNPVVSSTSTIDENGNVVPAGGGTDIGNAVNNALNALLPNSNGSTDTSVELPVEEDPVEDPAEDSVEDPVDNDVEPDPNTVPKDGYYLLPELATYHGLREVAKEISAKIAKVPFEAESRVLILDEIDLVPKTFSYLDIQKKIESYSKSIEMLLQPQTDEVDTLVKQITKNFLSFAKNQKLSNTVDAFLDLDMDSKSWGDDWSEGVEGGAEGVREVDEEGNVIIDPNTGTEKGLGAIPTLINSLGAINPVFTGLTTTFGAVSDTLEGLSGVFKHFSTEYSINDQTIQGIGNVPIQAMVAGDLVAKSENAKYELFKFEIIQKSDLLISLNELINDFYDLYKSTESLNTLLAQNTSQVASIETYLSTKKQKLAELNTTYSEPLIAQLKEEIQHVEQLYSDRITNRPSTARITNLETYLSTLQTKFIEMLTTDSAKAIKNLESQIEIIQKALEADAAAPDNKKMTQTKKDILLKQLENYQSQKTALEMAIGNNDKQILEREITRTAKKLDELQKEWYPDTHIESLEAELKTLKQKLRDQIVQKSNAEKLENSISALESDKNQLKKIIVKTTAVSKSGATLLAAITAFIDMIRTPVEAGKHPPIILACIQEYLATGGFTHFFYIQHVLSDADLISEERKTLSRYARNSYIGGGIVTYFLAKTDGELVASGTVGDHVVLDFKLKFKPAPLNVNITNSKLQRLIGQ